MKLPDDTPEELEELLEMRRYDEARDFVDAFPNRDEWLKRIDNLEMDAAELQHEHFCDAFYGGEA